MSMHTNPDRHDHHPSWLFKPTRRQWLATAAGTWGALRGSGAWAGDDASGSLLLKSQSPPAPSVRLPTDAIPPTSEPRRIAAVVTSYFRYSHADDIVTKFMEGYAIAGRNHTPRCQVVSLSIEQTGPTDIGRPFAARYSIPVFDTPTQAVTLGGSKLAVDGVLIVAEHGDYPHNTKGQQLYPRRRLFEEVTTVFRRSGRSVPVYNDKHLSYDWLAALGMIETSRSLGFPMMAGSSVPVAWRRPPLAFAPGIELEAALSVGFSGLEVYGFHTLELLQAFVEKRRGGETGIAAVQCLEGAAAWDAAERGLWRFDLLERVLATLPPELVAKVKGSKVSLDQMRKADPDAIVFLIEYSDGFRAAAYLSRGVVNEFAFAAKVRDRAEPVATWCELNKPQRDHFSFLCNHIEVMFRTGKASYPVERTLIVTGAIAALVDSHDQAGARIRTPHLAEVGYVPVPERETEAFGG